MKRFHVHLRVDNISENVDFYTAFFSQAPNLLEQDYAKWIIDDPRLNFAISNHGETRGISHLGIEIENEKEFLALQKTTLNSVTEHQRIQSEANCCYAKSNKHWLLDPQEVPWEIFHTTERLKEYGYSDTKESIVKERGCCE